MDEAPPMRPCACPHAIGWCAVRCQRPAGPGSDTCTDCRSPNLDRCTCACHTCSRIGQPFRDGASRRVDAPLLPPPSPPPSPSSSPPPTPPPSPTGIGEDIRAAVLTRGNESDVLTWSAEHEWHLRSICVALDMKHPKRSTYKAVRAVIAHYMGEYSRLKDAYEAYDVSEGTFRKFRKMLQPHLDSSGVGVVKQLRDAVIDDAPSGEARAATSAASI